MEQVKEWKRENKVTEDAAKKQLEWLNYFYDVDEKFLSEDAVRVNSTTQMGLLKAICRGRLEIKYTGGDEISILQHLSKPFGKTSTLSYKQYNDKAHRMMNRVDDENRHWALLSYLSSTEMDLFKEAGLADQTTSQHLVNYFLNLS